MGLKKVLIIQNKYIGDVLTASILAKNIKKKYPNSKVHFFCYQPAFGVLENNPYIDRYILFDDKKLKNPFNLWNYTSRIRRENYDIIIDPYAKLQSIFITAFSGVKEKISYNKTSTKYFYNQLVDRVEVPEVFSCTAIENRLRLLQPMGFDFSEMDGQTELFLTDEEVEIAKGQLKEAGLDLDKPILMIGVLGSGMDKSLPLDYMAEVLNHLIKYRDAQLLLNYVPNQQDLVDKILSKVTQPDRLNTGVLGNSIRELAALMTQVDALIANEGGAVNLAKALKINTFTFYSPHKFREDWACFENETDVIHRSFHIKDVLPELYEVHSLDEILKKAEKFYRLLLPKYFQQPLNQFLDDLKIPFFDNPHQDNLSLNYSISSLVITLNEERNIPQFLQNHSFADEIIVVDSNSTDQTVEIARNHPKVEIITHPFENFSKQKNFALKQANYPWILFFDADERLTPALKIEILLKITDKKQDEAFYVKRKFFMKDKCLHYSGWQNDKVVRLMKKGRTHYGLERKVHEVIDIQSPAKTLKNPIMHYSFVNEDDYVNKLETYAKLKAEELFETGFKPGPYHFYLRPIFRFLHHYIFRFGFLDGKEGYTLAKLYAEYVRKRFRFLEALYQKEESD